VINYPYRYTDLQLFKYVPRNLPPFQELMDQKLGPQLTENCLEIIHPLMKYVRFFFRQRKRIIPQNQTGIPEGSEREGIGKGRRGKGRRGKEKESVPLVLAKLFLLNVPDVSLRNRKEFSK
jgi:hypothetical protein